MSPLLQLLETIQANRFVETYRHFPDVVLSGGEFLDKEDFDHLIEEGYLVTSKQDSFGQLLELSIKAKMLLKKEYEYAEAELM